MYHCKRQQRKNRSLRNQARRKLGLKRGDGREVDHIRPLKFNKAKNPNTRRNLQVLSRKANRKKGSRR